MSTDSRLVEALTTLGAERCPNCGRAVDRGDVAWNTAWSDSGTDYSVITVICSRCGTEVLYLSSWSWPTEDLDDVVEALEDRHLDVHPPTIRRGSA